MRLGSTFAAAVLMIALAGCTLTNAPTTGGPEVLGEGEIEVEYAEAVENFPEPLPSGRAYPAEIGDEYQPSDAGMMERGMGEQVVAITWLCAWEAEYLDAFDTGDTARVDAALAMMAKWRKLPNAMLYSIDPDDLWTQIVLHPAQAGDPSGVRSEYTESCSTMQTVAAE